VSVSWPFVLPAPPHPPPREPVAGAAVSVIAVCSANRAPHVAPQSIPVGLLVTVPAPDPDLVTVSPPLNVAVHVGLPLTVTVVVVPVPLQAPLHPVKTDPGSANALRETVEPVWNRSWHAVPQSIPAGTDSTRPVPRPLDATVTVENPALSAARAVASSREPA